MERKNMFDWYEKNKCCRFRRSDNEGLLFVNQVALLYSY